MIQIAGPNGSGKTTLYKSLLEPVLLDEGIECAYINADDIEREMRDPQSQFSLGMNPDLSEFAQKVADSRRQDQLTTLSKSSFAFETVFSDGQGHRLRFMRDAKDVGYYVVMIFIGVDDVEISKARVNSRVEKGGHDVPHERQEQRFPRVFENGKKAISIANLSLFLDNSQETEDGVLMHEGVACFVDGQLLCKNENAPAWFSMIHQ